MTTLLITATHDLPVIQIQCTGAKRNVLCRKICANIDSKELHIELPINPKHSRHKCTPDRPQTPTSGIAICMRLLRMQHKPNDDNPQIGNCLIKPSSRQGAHHPAFEELATYNLPTTSMSPRSCSAAQPQPGDQQALR